jgi:Fur family ferric uptake transcriptional regulator
LTEKKANATLLSMTVGTSEKELAGIRAQLTKFMAHRGLRSTKQRDLIVESFIASADHVSIEDLLARVRQRDPAIGYATVYRTLRLLAESGVASERQFGDGLTRYELAKGNEHHDHLICEQCHTIIEFSEPAIESLQDAVAARFGFAIRVHKLELYGRCQDCQRKANPAR